MTDSILLNEKIAKSGIKKTRIAEELGITLNGLRKKIMNRSRFYADEIVKLCKVLDIKSTSERNRIFFCEECR